MLYEIDLEGADLSDIRFRLNLDSGYLSRIVQSLVAAKLVVLHRGRDARARRAHLTAKGRTEFQLIEEKSNQLAGEILKPLTEAQQVRLVAAVQEVYQLLRASGVHLEQVDPATKPARWCVEQYFHELAERFEAGFDPAQSISADDDAMRPPMGAFLLATVDGEAVACGAIKPVTPTIASIKRMWVADSMRGLGLGQRMLDALEKTARDLNFKVVRLETNRALQEAINLYRKCGYSEVAAFNTEPYAHHWFEKNMS